MHSSFVVTLLRFHIAREASKRIVEDLLTTAGADFDDTDGLEDSPSVVAMKDTFDDSF
jgi:DASH complex subunit ASK1